MKETIRTIILLVLLALAIGFIYWVRNQNQNTLQTGAHFLIYKP